MWDLRNGRNAFLGRHRGMPDRNFWWYLMRSHNQQTVLADPASALLWDWKPEHSNCPELNLEVIALANASPAGWRPLIRSVFVGRTFDGELNAEARQSDGSAWVGISLQYTSAVGAYITAFDRVRSIMLEQATGEPVSEAEITRVFEQIALSRTGWADSSQYVGIHPTLMDGPLDRDQAYYEPRVKDAEMFAICHEFAHHLLGHTNNAAKAFRIADSFTPMLRASGTYGLVYDRPETQTKELLADLVGLQLAALPRDGRETAGVYRTMIGSIAALLAEADVNGHWFLDDPDGHPATADRIASLLAIMPHMLFTIPLDGRDSVTDLRGQLAAYASACMQSSLHTHAPGAYIPATWKQLWSALDAGTMALAVPKGGSQSPADVKLAGSKLTSVWVGDPKTPGTSADQGSD